MKMARIRGIATVVLTFYKEKLCEKYSWIGSKFVW